MKMQFMCIIFMCFISISKTFENFEDINNSPMMEESDWEPEELERSERQAIPMPIVDTSDMTMAPHQILNSTNGTIMIKFSKPTGGYDAGASYKLGELVAQQMVKENNKPYADFADHIAAKLLKIDYKMLLQMADKTIGAKVNDLVHGMLPLLSFAGICIAIALLVPIIMIFYCCCIAILSNDCAVHRRKLFTEDARKQNRICGCVDGLLLGVGGGIILMCAGALFGVGMELPGLGPYVLDVVQAALLDLKTFFTLLNRNMKGVAIYDINFAIGVMVGLVKDMVNRVLVPFLHDLQPSTDGVQNAVTSFNKALNDTTTWSNASEVQITAVYATLNDIITAINGVIINAKTTAGQCSSSVGPTAPLLCASLSTAMAAVNPLNPQQTPPLGISGLINGIKEKNLTNIASTGTDTYVIISKVVDESTKNIQNRTLQVLLSVGQNIAPLIDNTASALGNFTNWASNTYNSIDGIRNGYGPIISYWALGIAVIGAVIFLLIMSFMIGVTCGLSNCAAYEPERRSAIGDYGGHMIKVSVCLSYVLMTLFLVIGAVIMVVGSVLSVTCRDIKDMSFIRVIDDPSTWGGEYKVADLVLQNGTIPLKLETILKTCKENNTPAYTALQLNNLIDMENIVDIKSQLPDMLTTSVSVQQSLDGLAPIFDDLSNQTFSKTISDTDTQMKAIKLDNINKQLSDVMQSANNTISTTITTMMTFVTQLQNAGAPQEYVGAWNGHITALQKQQQRLAVLKTTQVDMQMTPALNMLQNSTQRILIGMRNMQTALSNIQLFIKNNALDSMMNGLQLFIYQLVLLVDELKNHVTQILRTDLARCQLLYDLFNGMTLVSCGFSMEYVNAIWLSLIVMGYTMLFNIWFGSRLVKYFKIPDDSENYTKRRFFDPDTLPPRLQPLIPYMSFPEEWDLPPYTSFEVSDDKSPVGTADRKSTKA